EGSCRRVSRGHDYWPRTIRPSHSLNPLMVSMATALRLPSIGLRAREVLDFLRADLVPTPRRWRATLRITLACVAASWTVMAFHLHAPLLTMILIFLITREETTTTLLGTVLGVFGITIGCGLLLLTYICFTDLAWVRVLLVPTFIAL